MGLKDAKAGDLVAVRTGGWYPSMEKRRIARATKTMLVVDGRRYNRGGREIGSGPWHGPRIELWDEETHANEFREMREAAEKKRIATELSGMNWADLPIGSLRDILKAAKAANPTA